MAGRAGDTRNLADGLAVKNGCGIHGVLHLCKSHTVENFIDPISMFASIVDKSAGGMKADALS